MRSCNQVLVFRFNKNCEEDQTVRPVSRDVEGSFSKTLIQFQGSEFEYEVSLAEDPG